MEISVRLADLTVMHPRLLWAEISVAAVAVLSGDGRQPPFSIELAIRDVPGFANGRLHLRIDPGGVSATQVAGMRRTYNPSRLIESAAIAIAGLGLYHAGGHEIRDVALRGSTADYLVDEANFLLEVAGRSRRSDLNPAWQQRWQRLADSRSSGFYVCVVEFETPAGQLAFQP